MSLIWKDCLTYSIQYILILRKILKVTQTFPLNRVLSRLQSHESSNITVKKNPFQTLKKND